VKGWERPSSTQTKGGFILEGMRSPSPRYAFISKPIGIKADGHKRMGEFGSPSLSCVPAVRDSTAPALIFNTGGENLARADRMSGGER